MRGAILLFLVLLVVVTAFTLSNLQTVTVTFWQWPLYSGPLSLIVVGAVVLGALMTYLASLLHHSRQGRRIRSLEDKIKTLEAQVHLPSDEVTLPSTPGVVPRVQIVDKEGHKL